MVQHRLENIGLAPFCLELHSNKASKSSVLSQLEKSLEVGRIKHPEKYKATADRLKAMRVSMNSVIDGLHKKHESGISVYDAIEQYETCAEFKNKITIPQEVINTVNDDRIEQLSSLILSYKNSVDGVGDIVNNPLKNISLTEYSIPLREKLYSDCVNLLNLYNNAKSSVERIFGTFNINAELSEKSIKNILNLCRALLIPSAFSPSLILENNYKAVSQKLNNYYESICNENREKQEIEKVFTSGIYEYNCIQALNEWNVAQSSWILSRNSKQKKLLKEVATFCVMPNAVTKENIINWYQRLINFNKLHNDNMTCGNELRYILNELGSDYKQAIDKTDSVYNAISVYNYNEIRTILNAFKNINLAQLGNDVNCAENYILKWNEFSDIFKVNIDNEQSDNWLDRTGNTLNNISKNIDKLYAVTEYNAKREQLANEQLECICNAVESGIVNKENAVDAFRCNVYYALALKYISVDESLSTFRSNSFEQTIKEYHALIDEYSKLTVQELVAKLSSQVPASGSAGASSSELGILKRAIKSNGRMMSIRSCLTKSLHYYADFARVCL